METYPIHLAKTHLSRLVERACHGAEVVITRGREPVVRLVPIVATTGGRRFGSLKGRITVDERFFEPLPEDELAAWET